MKHLPGLFVMTLLLVSPDSGIAAPEASTFSVGSSCVLEVYVSDKLNETNTAKERAVIAIHGSSGARGGSMPYDAVWSRAGKDGVRNELLLIAPRLREKSHRSRCYWASNWREGGNSRNGSPRVSSFAVIDRLIEHILTSGRFPNIEQVVVAGHSAGGQHVGRYAMTTRVVGADDGTVQFVPSNPSSWAYTHPERPVPGSTTQFMIPNYTCRGDYDEWRYGLAGDSPPYVAAVGPTQIKSQFKNRIVTYFLGANDTGTGGLTQSCSANWQGPNRLLRGRAYYNHLSLTYGRIPPTHSKVENGCKHSASCMWRSDAGGEVLFPPLWALK